MDSFALFHEIGVGKSRTAIDILRHRCGQKDRLLKTLILSPKITLQNWKAEFAKYSKIHPRDIVILHGSAKKREHDFKEACLEDYKFQKNKIIITNYEAVEMENLYTMFTDWAAEVMIIDEAHRIKNPEGKRANKVIKLSKDVGYKYALTGTPILNSPMDIFNIFKFLDGGETFGANFWRFRSIWFEDENAQWSGKPGHFPKFVPRSGTYEEFNKLIYAKADRALKSECLDLPEFVRKEVHVEMGPEQKRLYQDMKSTYVAYIDDLKKTDKPRAVVAQLAITKALRLQQIVTGFAKTDTDEVYNIKVNPRIQALGELLEDLSDHKVIVWACFHENYADIAKLCEKMKIPYAELHGKVPEGKRQQNIKDFCTGPVQVLIANQQAAGIGINLVESDVSIYYSKNFSLEHDMQSEGRNYRGGSERHKSVTRIDLVCPETIDELILQTLARKQNVAEQILDWSTNDSV